MNFSRSGGGNGGRLSGTVVGNEINLLDLGGVTITAAGTNQNITFTPSGTGGVLIGGGTFFPYTTGALALNVNATSSTTSEIKLTNSTTGNSATAGMLLSCDGNNGYIWNGQASGTINFGTANAQRAQFSVGGRFLLGTTTDSGALLQVGANAATGAALAGMSFGGDTYLFRQSSTQMRLLGTTTNEGLWIQQSDAVTGIIVQTNAGVGSVETTAAGQSLVLKSGAQVTALTLDSSQVATFASSLAVASGATIKWLARSSFYSPSDGVITMYNNATSDFARLQFGGTTASFPALQRTGANLQVVDASGGAYTSILAATHISTAAAGTVSAGNVSYGGTTATTVGAAGGASALPATPTGYIIINVAGTPAKLPYYAA
jgi:hypothetical protein